MTVDAPTTGRISLGLLGRRLVAAEARQSVLVVGPTQTLKTSGLVVPAVLEWAGPVVATSVKTDVVRHTLGWRQQVGRVSIFDPTSSTGLASRPWNPLEAARNWTGARQLADDLVDGARSSSGGLSDSNFWLAAASKLLAPMLFAAAVSGRTMADVVRWVDTQETAELAHILEVAGVEQAITSARANLLREERQRSSVYTTAETILDPFADPPTHALAEDFCVDELLDGGSHTLYICAPSHEQRRLRPVFSALVGAVVKAVYERSGELGGPIDPPLLLVLDEAAAIAPLEELPGIASTGAGHGVQLLTVWQDLAQISARYGASAGTVFNNHRAKLLLSGVSDAGTLEALSALVGETSEPVSSVTSDPAGGRSRTESVSFRPLAPVDWLRRIPPGEAVLVYGHLPPVQLSLRPWFEHAELARRVGA